MLVRLHNYINRSFARRLLFFFVPYVVLLLVSLTLLSFSSFFNTLKEEKESSTRTLVSQIRDNFDYYFLDIKTMMAYVSINKDVQQALSQRAGLSISDQYFLNNRIMDAIGNVNVFKSFISDIIVIGKNGYKRNLPNYYSLNSALDLYDTVWLKNYHPSANSNFDFTSPHQADYYETGSPVRRVVSSILPLTVQGRVTGFLQGDIDYEKLRAVLDTVYNQNEIEITVITSKGTIVFDRNLDQVNAQVDDELFGHLQGAEGSFINQQQSESKLIVYLQSDVTGWYLIASIPYSALLTPSYTVSRTILFVILPISLLIALALFMFLSWQLRQPWSRLVHRIETATLANYQSETIDYGVGEIAELGSKFETMLAQNSQLIEQVYIAEIKKKNAELHALREQITPHFVYNSLQVIKAEAIFSKNKEISQTVTAIANLLRYSMDSRTSQVNVADEINYIRDYLEIYQRRYIGKFEFEINVAEEIMSCKVQKMILQPLVENCLKHGFEDMKSGGCIQIRGREEAGNCIFEVRDNGKGMSNDKMNQLRREISGTDQNSAEGIGLFNVHQRIIMERGAEYGILKIESKQGEYTRVVLIT